MKMHSTPKPRRADATIADHGDMDSLVVQPIHSIAIGIVGAPNMAW